MEIIGHERIREYLADQAERDQLTHAYLFTGPQHLGKSVIADWFAARLLCHGQASQGLFGPSSATKPCGQCPSCYALNKGLHADLHRLQLPEDEHSISIESMRTFLKSLSTSPSLGPRKVAILDDAHALTTAAANAFLKTLEEASASTTIVVVTHQPHKLLATILSRCQIIEFQPVRQVSAALAADPLWQASRGLPGVYVTAKETGEQGSAKERAKFTELLRQSPGERFLAIEPLFKKSSAHAEKKEVWKERLDAWRLALQDLLVASLQQQGGESPASPRQIQIWIDQLYALQELASAPINLRAHIEGFLASIPRLAN